STRIAKARPPTAGATRATRCAWPGSGTTSSISVPPPGVADGGRDGRDGADGRSARPPLDLPLSAPAADAAPAAGAAAPVAGGHLSGLAVRAPGPEPVPCG